MNVESLIARARARHAGLRAHRAARRAVAAAGLPPERIVKLDANENPYGTSPRALEALAAVARAAHLSRSRSDRAARGAGRLHRRADGAHPVRRRRRRGDRPAGARVRRAGPDASSTCRPPSACTSGKPTCSARSTSRCRGAHDFSVDVEAVEGTVRALEASGVTPKLLFVTNPNNPDGSVTPREDLLRLLDLPLVVVVDEAYIDFSTQQSRWRRSCASATT